MQKKQTMQNAAKQNYPGLIAFYDTRPENEVGLFYNAPERTRSSQPITWLILTNKTVQENTRTKYNSKKQTIKNTAKQN